MGCQQQVHAYIYIYVGNVGQQVLAVACRPAGGCGPAKVCWAILAPVVWDVWLLGSGVVGLVWSGLVVAGVLYVKSHWAAPDAVMLIVMVTTLANRPSWRALAAILLCH